VAAPIGTQDPGLRTAFAGVLNLLKEQPFAFRFFQAVRLLEQAGRGASIGRFQDPKSEPVRFGAHPSLAFPASEIQEWNERATPPRMIVNFMGLIGPSGVLPHVYTELVLERRRDKDLALQDFLDLFNHRLLSLFYRAWKRDHFGLQRESEPRDRLAFYLGSLAGIGTDGLQERLEVSDETLAYYVGLLSLQPRSAVALRQILMDYFQVPVEIQQFVGLWRRLSAGDTCTFQDGRLPAEMLGGGAVVGDAIWDQQSTVRIILGPLTLRQYDDFLPGRKGHQRLRQITRFFSRDQIDFEVRLILRREEVPGCALGSAEQGNQLGWTTWVHTRPLFDRNPSDAVLSFQ
jgi:type VI secretion system protein ImpH